MLRLLSLVSGIICLVAGFTVPSAALVIVGIILVAIGGVWIFIVDFGDGGSGGFDFNPFD